jgi:hypothetical protein
MSIVPRPFARLSACLRRVHLPAASLLPRPPIFQSGQLSAVPLQHTRPGGQRNIDFSDSTGQGRSVMRFPPSSSAAVPAPACCHCSMKLPRPQWKIPLTIL